MKYIYVKLLGLLYYFRLSNPLLTTIRYIQQSNRTNSGFWSNFTPRPKHDYIFSKTISMMIGYKINEFYGIREVECSCPCIFDTTLPMLTSCAIFF